MDIQKSEQWKNEMMAQVFSALASSPSLVGQLVFKGAQVLSRRLNDHARQSYDIDANLIQPLGVGTPESAARKEKLQQDIRIALEQHFGSQDPVRYTVESVRLELKPSPRGHQHGWNAFLAVIGLRQPSAPTNPLPGLQLDMAAPEELGARSIAPLSVNGHDVNAYTELRIAAEKLRAFLQSLPTYRAKMSRHGEVVRVKDLFDLKRILQRHELADEEFWSAVAAEFRNACASRYVDCAGWTSFAEDSDITRASFEYDPTIPKSWAFEEVWAALEAIVRRLEALGLFPMNFPLPATE